MTFTRLDTSATNDPARFVSSIYVDPDNANHAWVSYSGYNINTPAQPGHVFEVNRIGGTATWTDRTYNLADLPVTDLVRDDATGDLYASTDFGVFTLASGDTSWSMTAGLPMVEVPGLTIVPSKRILYAATHGLGAWRFGLPKLDKSGALGRAADEGPPPGGPSHSRCALSSSVRGSSRYSALPLRPAVGAAVQLEPGPAGELAGDALAPFAPVRGAARPSSSSRRDGHAGARR